jgi:hypothetical protein
MLRLLTAVSALLVSSAAATSGGDLSERAAVLARKEVTSEFTRPIGNGDESKNVLVEGEMFNVTITLYNQGGLEATDIEVEDEWEEDKFDVVPGDNTDMTAKFESIAPGETLSYSFALRPKFNAEKNPYEFKPAMVTYQSGEDETIATSSRPHTPFYNRDGRPVLMDGKAWVLSKETFDSQTAMFFREWGIFGLVAAGPVLGPLLLMWHVSSGTEAIISKRSN